MSSQTSTSFFEPILAIAIIIKNDILSIQKIIDTFKKNRLALNFDLLQITPPYAKYLLFCLEEKANSHSKPQQYTHLTTDEKLAAQRIFLNDLKSEDLELVHEIFDLNHAEKLKSLNLIAFDMDSTLINIECIDEMAKAHGCFEQVSAITERAMQGELDFNQSLIMRLNLLKGADQSILNAVLADLKFNQGVEEFFQYLKTQKPHIQTILISGGFDFFANYVKKKLGIDLAIAHQLKIINAKLTGEIVGEIINADTKANLFIKHQKIHNNQAQDILDAKTKHQSCISMAVGDGANDLKMLQAADFGVAFYAKPALKTAATFCINQLGMDTLITLYEYARYQHTCRLGIHKAVCI